MNEAPEIRTAIVERDIAHPPEKIWRALTQPHLLEEWLMATDFLPEMGHKFTFRRQPSPEVKVVIDCEVLTLEPYSTLAYSWSAFGLESTVTFTLEPIATGTRLRMEQAGFRIDQDRAYKGALASWKQFFARLDSLVSTLD
ncbi:MAG: SRPBCC domain-containing protein [Devosia sp.]|uniref:SRPBCC family protein n=1 Tax=unclassified Devosia TaxID=196773 RepID=UPI0019FA249B|nr:MULTISPECIES: SRPBCC domain-containing protein [unclassified Devosia]MBF0678505.1 SRPBCC domain-containing protein [Devosia sp.]WEJ33127.1 SRPBCC domain-containing protein [Devosia sp. SD17-2]